MFKGFKEGDVISAVVMVKSVFEGTASNSNKYVKLVINDGSTDIDAFVWDLDIYDFTEGETVKLKAKISKFKGKMKLDVLSAEKTDQKIKLPSLPDDEMKDYTKRFEAICAEIKDEEYWQLLDDTISSVKDDFFKAPAAKQNHQAYLGGLLEHSVHVAELCHGFYKQNPKNIDLSLLLCGAVLHDIGKIKAYTYETSIDRSTSGQLIEHISIGLMILSRMIPQDFPMKKFYNICHMIVSHHGKREWGSPVCPLTKEAVLLHQADMIDSYSGRFDKIAEDNEGKEWSEFDMAYNRRWYLDK